MHFSCVDVVSSELPIKPVLEIFPQNNIYEGDRLTITCTVSNSPQRSGTVSLFVSQGIRLLSSGKTRVNHSLTAVAKDPGVFECKLEMGNVVKVVNETVSVTGEL